MSAIAQTPSVSARSRKMLTTLVSAIGMLIAIAVALLVLATASHHGRPVATVSPTTYDAVHVLGNGAARTAPAGAGTVTQGATPLIYREHSPGAQP